MTYIYVWPWVHSPFSDNSNNNKNNSWNGTENRSFFFNYKYSEEILVDNLNRTRRYICSWVELVQQLSSFYRPDIYHDIWPPETLLISQKFIFNSYSFVSFNALTAPNLVWLFSLFLIFEPITIPYLHSRRVYVKVTGNKVNE